MNRAEFLSELDRRLRLIPQEDREDAIAYYDEYIGDSGLGEDDDVIPLLGTPKEVAGKIINDCTARYAEEQKETKSVRSGARTVWLAILGVASLPVALPLAIVALVLVLVLAITVFTVILALGISGVAGVLGGIAMVIAAFFTFSIGNILYYIGIGSIAAGVGIFILMGAVLLKRAAVSAFASMGTKKTKVKGV